jgi:cobalt-precorrin 5A hydrolase
MGGGEAMAVIGIGTTSRVTVADVLAVIADAMERAGKASQKVPPHPNPLPEGRGGHRPLQLRLNSCGSVPSPLGEKDRMRGAWRDSGGSSTIGSFLPEGWHLEGLFILATLDRAAINSILEDAAGHACLRLVFLSLDDLLGVASRCVTHSEKSMRQYGVPSVAEAAALAAAGTGSRLLIPRFCGRSTTASVAIAS